MALPRIAINGFGRNGRTIMRIAKQRTEMAALITKAEQRAERALERAFNANDKAERAVFTANNKQCSHGDAQNPG